MGFGAVVVVGGAVDVVVAMTVIEVEGTDVGGGVALLTVVGVDRRVVTVTGTAAVDVVRSSVVGVLANPLDSSSLGG